MGEGLKRARAAALATQAQRTSTDRSLLVYAVRYALGRQSYAVGQVCDEVKRLAPLMDANERAVLVRDISWALKRADDHGETLGMQMDHDEWTDTLAALRAVPVPLQATDSAD